MAGPDPLEKKLDRYYDDIMTKIMEVIEVQRNILGEQKDLKKDIAKVKEHLLEAKSDIERLENKINTKGSGGAFRGGEGSDGPTGAAPRIAPPTYPMVSALNGEPSSHSPQASGPKTSLEKENNPSKAPPNVPSQNLKDYLAQQVAIYDVKVLNAFIKSTKEIIKTNSRVEPTFQKPLIESNLSLPIVIAGRMKLSRDKGSGSMAFCLEQASATALTKAVFMMPDGAKVSEADIKDVTSEICNQIVGKCKLTLKNEGYSFAIEMPEIHQGSALELNALLGYPKIVLFFDFAKNPFYIYFWG